MNLADLFDECFLGRRRQVGHDLDALLRTVGQQDPQCVPPDRRMADLLSVGLDSALLFFERVSFSQENIPVEFLRIYYRGDRYVLYNELTG